MSPDPDLIAHLVKLGGVISLQIKDAAELQQIYMPFVRGGGLFIATAKKYRMGDELFLRVKTPQDDTPHEVAAKVVWMGHAISAARPGGIGLQLMPGKEAEILRETLEKMMIGVSPDKATLTM